MLLLWRAGFETFTSCEGGKGHSFRHETIGLELEGEYPAFQERLVRFLRSQGMKNFRISLVTDYTVTCPEGEVLVYLEGLDIISSASTPYSLPQRKAASKAASRDRAATAANGRRLRRT